ncbi:putative hydroxybutyrate dehydrogenase [Talaromyces proteolyticus]|uniref:Hydroxybutyrate dehydrogenase n=1 Tax=Talaromyces proteolyticus TaxID=1131652 RepID=A0AAD4Q2E5_9EURO|nr:putative hydroxybutyrate dehydrogenase [Talaromyces proteolyticus]KAH8700296.1 putative hydroxybutyrate dehydrogenase [Talaromyces proteolyticus]
MAPLVWLVTGCSSGFGVKQFVLQALARGDKVIATGRNAPTKLAHLEGNGASILNLDLTMPESEIADRIKEAHQIHGRIDILVNNAGYLEVGTVEELSLDRVQRSFATNYFGPLKITRAILPVMRDQKSGTVAFMGSIGGWGAVPNSSAYAACKYALEALTEALQSEFAALFGNDINFIVFEPGYFRTEIFSTSNAIHPPTDLPEYEAFNQASEKRQRKIYQNEPGDPVKGVARMIEVLTGTGLATGKTFPLRLPLGSDSLHVVRKKCQDTLKLCDEWEDVIMSTDLPSKANEHL